MFINTSVFLYTAALPKLSKVSEGISQPLDCPLCVSPPHEDTPGSRGGPGDRLTLWQLCMPPAHPRIRMRRMAGIWIPNVQPAGNVIAVPGKGQAETETGTERESCQRRRPAGVCSPLTTRRSPGLVRNC